MIVRFVVCSLLASAVYGVRPPATTTLAPESGTSKYPADARWTVESADSGCDITICSDFYTEKDVATACRDDLGCGEVRYLRAFPFRYCKASDYFVIPVDGNAGRDDSFWDGEDPFMYLPVVNAGEGSNLVVAADAELTMFNSSRSSGGDSCNLDPEALNPNPDYAADVTVTGANISMVRIDLFPFLEASYMGLDRSTIVIKPKATGGLLPAPLVGPHSGYVGVFPSEPAGALATLATSLIGVVAMAALLL